MSFFSGILMVFLAPLTIVGRSLSDINLSGGVRQLFQIATSPTFFNGFFWN